MTKLTRVRHDHKHCKHLGDSMAHPVTPDYPVIRRYPSTAACVVRRFAGVS